MTISRRGSSTHNLLANELRRRRALALSGVARTWLVTASVNSTALVDQLCQLFVQVSEILLRKSSRASVNKSGNLVSDLIVEVSLECDVQVELISELVLQQTDQLLSLLLAFRVFGGVKGCVAWVLLGVHFYFFLI